MSEFKRLYGDVRLDLGRDEKAEQCHFVELLLATEPHCLGAEFKDLTRHTAGHPLFTVELLRAMQARGDLVRDGAGQWTEGRVLDWKRLPARIEGVIEERVSRLDLELHQILAVASVEGEEFTAQVVARALEMEEDRVLRCLAQELEVRHRLVREQGETPSDAGRRAAQEAVAVANVHRGRGQAHETLGEFEPARRDYEAALEVARGAGECRAEWRALLDLAKLWRARDYSRTRDYLEQALDLAHRLGDPASLADSLNWLGNWHLNMEEPQASLGCHVQALGIFERLGDRRAVAATLNLLGIASLIGCDTSASAGYYERAVALFREMDDRPHLTASLTGRGLSTGTSSTLQAVALAALPIVPLRDFEEAQCLAREIGTPASEAWVLWALGLLHMTEGRYGAALEAAQRSYDIAARIGHREWIVGSRCVLAHVYVELLAPERAQRQIEAALPLAEELCSRHWIHNGTGTLAAAYGQLGDWGQAQACLETVLNAGRP